eukprot:5156862-Ditylum_brightwellii.AAC.1
MAVEIVGAAVGGVLSATFSSVCGSFISGDEHKRSQGDICSVYDCRITLIALGNMLDNMQRKDSTSCSCAIKKINLTLPGRVGASVSYK